AQWSGTPTFAVSGSGSGLGGASTFYVVMAYIGWDGESQASAEGSQALSTADTVTVTFTSQPGALLYKLYGGNTASGGAGTETLVAILPYQLYDANGTPQDKVISVQFTTNPAVRNATIAQMNAVNVGSAATLGGIVPSVTTSVPFCMAKD